MTFRLSLLITYIIVSKNAKKTVNKKLNKMNYLDRKTFEHIITQNAIYERHLLNLEMFNIQQ